MFDFTRFLMAVREGVTAKMCLDTSLHVDAREVHVLLMAGVVLLVSFAPGSTGTW